METTQATKTNNSPANANTRPAQASRFANNRPRFGAGQNRFAGQQKGENRFGGRGRQGFGRRRFGAGPGDGMDSKLLDLSRVSHTRAGGRRLRFRAIIISGNKAGKVGLGVASGSDVAQAVEKATIQSKKKMTAVPTEKGTISHEVISKVGPARVILKPQKKGRGLIAGGVVRLICQLAGIKDISSKMLGTTKNKINNARVVIKAFEQLKIQTAKKAIDSEKENQTQAVEDTGDQPKKNISQES